VKLHELAFASQTYSSFTNNNADYDKLRAGTRPALDLHRPGHRKELINWLAQGGCRQFVLYRHDLASAELLSWYKENHGNLLPANKQLWEITVADIEVIPKLFDTLAARASFQKEGQTARFGATAASKILFALRPHSMIPWDAPIRMKLYNSGSGDSYVEYLVKALREIESLMASCQRDGISIENVPGALKRDGATLAQLMGEYFWVTLTKEYDPH
jgi:hypothetical protein